MRDWVRSFKVDPTIRDKAVNLVMYVPRREYASKVRAIFNWVKSNVRYVPDPRGVEQVSWPTTTMSRGFGDCDDHATLVSALAESIGIPTRFVAVALEEPGFFQHVYSEALIGQDWVALDTTEPDKPMGWRPPGIVSAYIVRN